MNKVITREVAESWHHSEPACNNGAQFWTDGQSIYSYKLPIGYTTPAGDKVALDYTSGGSQGVKSMTTSKHVGYVKSFASTIE